MKQVFYDPRQRRRKILRRLTDLSIIGLTAVLVVFASSVLSRQTLPELLLPTHKPNYKALKERQPELARKYAAARPTRRRSHRHPVDIVLNQDEGLRAAFYENDEQDYSSLKAHIHQIDLLFPDWLHVVSPNGELVGSTSLFPVHLYDVVDAAGVHGVDPQNRVKNVITAAREDTDVFPMLNDYNVLTQQWNGEVIGKMLQDPAARERLHRQLDQFLSANPSYRGICLDFEQVPDADETLYAEWVGELHHDFSSKKLKIYVNVQVSADDAFLKLVAQDSDGIILMNYDEHEETSDPGPVAGEPWFEANLTRVLKLVPKQKIICGIGNYGFDWAQPLPEKGKKPSNKVVDVDDLTVQDAWQLAADAGANVHLEGDELNPHFAYDDEDAHLRHQVWFLDGVTALNELRAGRQMGLRTFALWRLGEEDPSLWQIWDRPGAKDAPEQLETVPPGANVDTEGEGDILRIVAPPQIGERKIQMDAENVTVIDEDMIRLPHSYMIQQYGYDPHKVALTFDDGPDPVWTPKILDVLQKYHVHATFMVIGEEAQNNIGVLKRYIADGDEIGNHTYTHPDISDIPPFELQEELNWTERLFAAELGIQPLYFRPPYSIDQEPDTNDEAAPAYRIQQLGYTIIGDKIDTDDWNEHPRKSPQEITDSVLQQIDEMKTHPWMKGSIILMHDGGGNRSATVAALPLLITTLRSKGYQFVQVSDLMGKTRAEVMPPIAPKMRWQARIDSVAFFFMAFFAHFVVDIFFIGDVLMSARLVLIGIFALIDRIRRRRVPPGVYEPAVAVLIPAYNEEKVIVRTIRSVLHSDYPHIRVVVIDDGSNDRTFDAAREAYPKEIAEGRLLVLTKPNSGKAEALNMGIDHVDEEIYVGIDADTVIAPDAVRRLVRYFADKRVGAVAGNAKVGNRVNLWTRWQALEYITSQNFERRAMDLFNVVTVVPGAIGAWRTAAVKAAGCYPVNTVAEDADLTMNLLEHQYKVIYDDHALAFTEAPATARSLMRQRFRWSFGILQAVFKHRAAARTNRAMGFFALPNILIFQILLPLVSPFIDIMFAAGVVQYLIDRHYHPETTSAASFDKLVVYFLAFLLIDFATSALAFSLEPRHPANKGDIWLLPHIWLQRFSYRQLFSIVLFRTLKRAVEGRPFNWEKVERTARMSRQTEKIAAGQ
ncbi:MAG TPA: glycosyltransferase [Acidobacteriaceae bacterium]|jgi:cellulose synthase/poly-beta-1,6-N-acetylglucosamine synthase-like glycosyltransferase/peptidoglycan/xylan/chitin deacetylase (PgdA/CDA1 family)/spore germination protein YaaH|nr:glycosyltransferase [Acidobacteriaceae bacterium]